MEWLVASLVLSVVLTVLLNVFLHAFPNASRRAGRRFDEYMTSSAAGADDDGRRVRVVIPWKTMILASVILTILINVLLRL